MSPNADQLPKQVPWRRSFSPVRRTADSEALICRLAPSHHGEAVAVHPSSAEADLFLQARSMIQTNPSGSAAVVRY